MPIEQNHSAHDGSAEPRRSNIVISDSPVAIFTTTVTEPQVSAALHAILPNGRQENREMPGYATAMSRLQAEIDLRPVNKFAPSWFNLLGFYTTISEASAMRVWTSLLESSPQNIQREVLGYERTNDISHAATIIETNNAPFITTALAHSLTGLVIGGKVDECNRSRDLKYIDEDRLDRKIPRDTIGKAVAHELGQRFPDPPRDPEELLARMQEVIPAPGSGRQSKETLFGLLKMYNTFDMEKPDRGIISRCPAIHLTGMILNEWGKYLATDQTYQQRFIKSVTRDDI